MHFTVGIAQLGGGTNGCRSSPHHHHLLRPRRLGKIILGLQQIALLRDPWRVATSGADDVQRELVLQFRLSACPLRMEQSRPTQDWPETATDSTKFLLGVQRPAIIGLSIEASLRGRLHDPASIFRTKVLLTPCQWTWPITTWVATDS